MKELLIEYRDYPKSRSKFGGWGDLDMSKVISFEILCLNSFLHYMFVARTTPKLDMLTLVQVTDNIENLMKCAMCYSYIVEKFIYPAAGDYTPEDVGKVHRDMGRDIDTLLENINKKFGYTKQQREALTRNLQDIWERVSYTMYHVQSKLIVKQKL